MDDDLGLMPDTDRRAVKQGRRAQQPQPQPQKTTQSSKQVDFDGSILEKSQERRTKRTGNDERKSKLASSLLESDDSDNQDDKPKRAGSKPKSTWDIDPSSDGRGEDAYDDERLMAKAGKPHTEDDESDGDIPQIPELEDTKDVVTTDAEGGVVSVSPGVVTKITTYRELEDDLMKHLPFLTLDQEVDLKPLTKFLIPEAFTVEADVPWEWETLYVEVASELMKEIESLQHLNLDPAAAEAQQI